MGVNKTSGVADTTVDVNSGVRVAVFNPTSVGVFVYVGVKKVGVALGISVGGFVDVGAGVLVATGPTEQEDNNTAQIKKIVVFFMWINPFTF